MSELSAEEESDSGPVQRVEVEFHHELAEYVEEASHGAVPAFIADAVRQRTITLLEMRMEIGRVEIPAEAVDWLRDDLYAYGLADELEPLENEDVWLYHHHVRDMLEEIEWEAVADRNDVKTTYGVPVTDGMARVIRTMNYDDLEEYVLGATVSRLRSEWKDTHATVTVDVPQAVVDRARALCHWQEWMARKHAADGDSGAYASGGEFAADSFEEKVRDVAWELLEFDVQWPGELAEEGDDEPLDFGGGLSNTGP